MKLHLVDVHGIPIRPLSMHFAQWYYFCEQVLPLRRGSQEEEHHYQQHCKAIEVSIQSHGYLSCPLEGRFLAPRVCFFCWNDSAATARQRCFLHINGSTSNLRKHIEDAQMARITDAICCPATAAGGAESPTCSYPFKTVEAELRKHLICVHRLQKVLFPTLKSKHPGKKCKTESDGDSTRTTCSNKAEKIGDGRGDNTRKALGALDTSRDFGLRKKGWHLV